MMKPVVIHPVMLNFLPGAVDSGGLIISLVGYLIVFYRWYRCIWSSDMSCPFLSI